MVTAIIGLLGVIAGGFVTFATQLAVARRSERVKMRAATLYMQKEVVAITAALGLKQLDGFEDATLGTTRLLEEWETHRDDLARLPTDAWYALITLVATIDVGASLGLHEISEALSRELGEANTELERALTPPRRERGLIVAVACAVGRIATSSDRFWMRWRASGIVRANRLAPRDRSGSGRRP